MLYILCVITVIVLWVIAFFGIGNLAASLWRLDRRLDRRLRFHEDRLVNQIDSVLAELYKMPDEEKRVFAEQMYQAVSTSMFTVDEFTEAFIGIGGQQHE